MNPRVPVVPTAGSPAKSRPKAAAQQTHLGEHHAQGVGRIVGYQRGVRELLEKEFLYRSPSDGVFFVNIRFMFNGDRLAFVRTYHMKDAARQQELPLAPAPPHALPAPDKASETTS